MKGVRKNVSPLLLGLLGFSVFPLSPILLLSLSLSFRAQSWYCRIGKSAAKVFSPCGLLRRRVGKPTLSLFLLLGFFSSHYPIKTKHRRNGRAGGWGVAGPGGAGQVGSSSPSSRSADISDSDTPCAAAFARSRATAAAGLTAPFMASKSSLPAASRSPCRGLVMTMQAAASSDRLRRSKSILALRTAKRLKSLRRHAQWRPQPWRRTAALSRACRSSSAVAWSSVRPGPRGARRLSWRGRWCGKNSCGSRSDAWRQ